MLRAFAGVFKKELTQSLRDKTNLRLFFVMPILQLLIMGYAVNTDVKRIALDVYDYSQSAYSRQLIQAFKAGDYFRPVEREAVDDRVPIWQLEDRFRAGKSEMAVIIPKEFSEQLENGDSVTLGWIADGSDANSARIGTGYAQRIVQSFSSNVLNRKQNIELRYDYLFNPEAESRMFMVPGVVATLLTMLTLMMTAMAIVRERELGTLEQVMVTPINSVTLMFGKLSYFALVSMAVMGFTLQVGLWWFNVPFVGSHLLLVVLSLIYLLSSLGLGLLVSTLTHTQQQAMFLAWFLSIFTMLTSGYFTPVANMPVWLQHLTIINPMRYYIDIVRGIIMKGSGVADLWESIIGMTIIGLIAFTSAALRFHKRMV